MFRYTKFIKFSCQGPKNRSGVLFILDVFFILVMTSVVVVNTQM